MEPARIPGLIFDVDKWFIEKPSGASAFIIPSTYNSALHVALSMSLSLARRGFRRRVADRLQNGFRKGERVAVLPSGEIYEYDGHFKLESSYGLETSEGLLRLRLIGDPGGGSISFPESEIARLERTDKSRPLGKKGIKLGPLALTDLDRFLGTRSGGNKDFFETDVFVITSPSKFERFVSGTTIMRLDKPDTGLIETSLLLPWGKLRLDGTVTLAGAKEVKGRPLIAVSARLDPLMQFLTANPDARPRIIIDGTAAALNNPTVFADLADRTPVAIVAGFKDVPAIRNLTSQCNLEAFQVRPDRLESWKIEHGNVKMPYGGIFQECLDAANNAVDFEAIEILDVSFPKLDRAAQALDQAAANLAYREPATDQSECLKSLFRILLRSANDIGSAADTGLTEDLQTVANEFSASKRFWEPETAKLISMAIGHLGQAIRDEEGPRGAKRSLIGSFLGREISADDELQLQNREMLVTGKRGHCILLTGWPGRRKLEEIVYGFRTSRIVALAFAFEAEWFQNFNRRYRDTELYSAARDLPYRPSEGGTKPEPLPKEPEADKKTESGRTSLEDLLNRSPARARASEFDRGASTVDALGVEFSDGRYAFLTADHKVPVVLSFGRFEGKSNAQVATLPCSDLEIGQLCVFRQGSDGDAVRLFAEVRLGERTYNELREIATSWRKPLRGLVTYPAITIGERTYAPPNVPAIIAELRNAGFTGSTQTVRNWILNPRMIGPGDRSSLDLIAKVTGDEFLGNETERVWKAMQKLRHVHMQAGTDLTKALLQELPDKILAAGRHTGTFSLTFGDLEVVEVYEIASTPEPVPVELTNRLLGEA